MTTTSKAENSKSTKAADEKKAPIGDGWDDAPKVGGLTVERPRWCPMWQDMKDEVVRNMLTTVPEGSHIRNVIVGKLAIEDAFGEPRYFVDEVSDGKTVRMALPNHGVLTAALDRLDMKKDPLVRIDFQGRAARSRQGQQAAFLYDVRCKPADAFLAEPRADALLPIHKANKANQESENS